MTDSPPAPRPPEPPHGPYGVPVWDDAESEWRIRLTDAGRDELGAWCGRHGSGVALFRSVYPAAYQQAVMAGLKTEDMDGACRRALVRAMGTWHPDRAKFSTYAAIWLRAYVQQDAAAHHRQAGRFQSVSGHTPVRLRSGEVFELFDGVAAEEDVGERMAAAEEAGGVRAALDRLDLPPRQRRVIDLLYGLTTGEPAGPKRVAEETGLTIASVKLIESTVLGRLREELSDPDDDFPENGPGGLDLP